MSEEPKQKLTIEPPTVEKIAQSFIDASGYHDAENIPTKDVFRMLVAFALYEHRWNVNLAKMIDDIRKTQLAPSLILRKEEFFKGKS